MGGVGSGRPAYGSSRETIEGCKAIDVNWMRRTGRLEPGEHGQLFWTRNGERAGDIRWRAEAGRLVLNFRYRMSGKDWQSVEQPLPIAWTPCRFGGDRPWFRCPGTVNSRRCGRRVLKVYAGGRYFLCRHCYGLAYACQGENRLDRLVRRTDKRRGVLGGAYCLDAFLPEKPRGMHWRTYWQHAEEIESIEAEINRRLVVWLGLHERRI